MNDKDHDLAGRIIDIVLENAQMHRMPKEGLESPVFCLGLSIGETYTDIVGMLKEHRECKKLDVAKAVYKSIASDGCYGCYVLGDDLWDEFDALFSIEDKEGI